MYIPRVPSPLALGITGTLALIGLGYLAIRRYALAFLRTRGRRSQRNPVVLGLDASAFEIPGANGALRGWFVRAAHEPRPTLVFAHGWHSHAGDMLLWAQPLVAAGHHVIVYDSLGHGESDPAQYTSLHHLREDLRAMLHWAERRAEAAPGLVIFGHSMGGAAAILAAEDVAAVRAIIVAGAPVDPLEITREWLDARRLPGALMVGVMRHVWKSIIPTPYAMLRPLERIRWLALPILILHGAKDRHVGAHHAERLAQAQPGAELHIFPERDHYDLPADPRYVEIVTRFVERAVV